MTAIVGILNKHGVAVAADSAETIGRGVKIYNKANKIFTLSKYEPVGVAVYGNASFCGLTPLDIIFKMYRKELQKTSFNTVEDYVNDFISYFAKMQFFASETELKHAFNQQVYMFFNQYIVRNRICGGMDANITQQELTDILPIIRDECLQWEAIDSVADIKKNEFEDYISEFLQQTEQELNDQGISYVAIKKLLVDAVYVAFTHKDNLHAHSGIAVFGYGKEEIYPHLCELKIYGVLCGKLKWYVINEYHIDNGDNSSWICPMAQSDVMITILRGVEPQLLSSLYQLMSDTLLDSVDKMANQIEARDPALADELRKKDKQPSLDLLRNNIEILIRQSHVGPLMDTIATLPKEDLAEVAENLIYLTSLMRRITPDQESVGGPIDVALVSKGDGFIWMKRKHYFDKELNRNYFAKYLMEDDKLEA